MNPIKPTIKTEALPVILILSSIAASFYFYSVFPEKVPIHWNFAGEVDGYGSKATGAFLFPGVILFIYVLFLLLPLIDPKKEKYGQFVKTFHVFKNVLVGFLALLYLVTSTSVLGSGFSPAQFVPAAVGVLFMILGNYMPKLKTNWFMGVRTPWTLSSEVVWQKTHRLAGKIFFICGLIFIAIPFLPGETMKIAAFVISILAMSVGSIGYSYFVYRQEKNKQ